MMVEIVAAIEAVGRRPSDDPHANRMALIAAVAELLEAQEPSCGKALPLLVPAGEMELTPRRLFHRFPADFYVPRVGVAIVCSAGESLADVRGRIRRLAASQRVKGIVLATCALDHRAVPQTVFDKPVAVALLR